MNKKEEDFVKKQYWEWARTHEKDAMSPLAFHAYLTIEKMWSYDYQEVAAIVAREKNSPFI